MVNQYLPFGTAGGANVLAPSDYNALPARQSGFVAGEAKSQEVNSVWRQSSVAAAMIGQFVNDIGGLDALDDGIVANLLLSFERSIQNGKLNYAVAGGAANALTVSMTPTPASYTSIIGMALRLRISVTNTGAASLNANSLGPLPIKTMIGADIGRGDLPSGAIVTLICTGTTWALASIAYSEVPIIGDTTIYVRTDGSDSNDGSANDSAHALATITEALNRAKKAGSSNTVTIQLGIPGTYAERIVVSNIAASIIIQGDIANQDNYIIGPTGSIFSVLDASNARVTTRGIRLLPTGTVTQEVYGSSNATVSLNYTSFSSSGTISNGVITAATGAAISISTGCNIFASAGMALNAAAAIISIDANVTVGSPTYSIAFAFSSVGGAIIRASSAPTITATSVTGTRYIANLNGIINTNGGGANYFPGTVAGSTATGGQYA